MGGHQGNWGNIWVSNFILEPHSKVTLQDASTTTVYWCTGLERKGGKWTSRSQIHSLSTCFIHLQHSSSIGVSLWTWRRPCLCLCLLSGGGGGEGGDGGGRGGDGGGPGVYGSNEHAWFTSANWEAQSGRVTIGGWGTHWLLDPLGCSTRKTTINTIFGRLCMSISPIDKAFCYLTLEKAAFKVFVISSVISSK